jgi:hypothetical protein
MAVKTSKDISKNIKRLNEILERQREALKALSLNDPDFAATKNAIQKTTSEIESNKSDLAKAVKKERTAKANVSLAEAKENLAYAEASGDTEEIKKAKDALNIADRDVKGKDSDKDGIPDTIDAEPNTPKKLPTPAPIVTTTPAPDKKVPRTPKETPLTDAAQREEALNVAAGQDFTLPETIFNNVPSLKAILERYVKEDWTPDKLRKAIRDDVWYRQNSGAIKQRYVQLFNYRDLVKTGQAQGTTQYEQDIVKLERQIADKARAVGSGIASDPAALRKAAENMYITNVGIDDAMTTDFIAAAIRPIGSTIAGQPTLGYSGQALKDYQELQSVARANGFKISDIIPGRLTEEQVLQGIATGRIDANRIAQDARKLAAQGRPEYVRDLLGQGYNLDQVYSPYRQTMANVLELNPDEIDLNDPSLGIAINDKGDMNISEFKRALRKDSRWQYTDQAKEEVSSIALKVLRDFGFQG